MSDLISREYLLEIARNDEAYGYVSEHDIINAPSAEKVGEWEPYNDSEHPIIPWYICTNCKGHNMIPSPFCPFCGARMKRSE